MKILLLSLPYNTLNDPKVAPPIGLLYIASLVKNMGVDVKIVDLNVDLLPERDLLDNISEYHPDLVGVSCMSPQFKQAVDISKLLPYKTIIGGSHATALPEQTMARTNFDMLAIGESEMTMLDLIQNNLDPTEVKGLVYRKGNKIVRNPDRELIKNIDSLPCPDLSLVDITKYTRTINKQKATNIITSRGCPGKCIFCMQDSIWKGKVRFHSPEYVLSHIDYIKSKYGITYYLILDDTLTANRDRALKIFAGLKERSIHWRGWTRADYIDYELACIMKDSGCEMLCIGVEHYDATILKNLKKRTTPDENRRAVEDVKRSGLVTRISVIVGAPGETWDTVELLKNEVIKAKPDDWLLNIFVPVPGSESFAHPEKFGMILDRDCLDDFSQYFVISGEMQSGSVMEYLHLKKEEIVKMRDYLYAEFREKCPSAYWTREGIK